MSDDGSSATLSEEGSGTSGCDPKLEYRERFRPVGDSIQEIFWMLDAATKQVLYVSQAYERICGRTCASLYEAPLSYREVIHPDDRERVLSPREASGQDWLREDEFRIVRPDGEVRWLSTRTFPIRDAKQRISRLCGVAQDITERKAGEERLQSGEARLRQMIEEMPVSMFRVDPEGVLEMVNPAMVRLLRYPSKEALLEGNMADYVTIRSEDFARMARKAERFGVFSNLRMPWKTRDGRLRNVQIAGRAVRDEGGRLRAIEGAAENLQARYSAERITEATLVGRGFVDGFVAQLATIMGCTDLLLLSDKLGKEDRKIAEELSVAAANMRSLSDKAQELFPPQHFQRVCLLDLNRFAREVEEYFRPLLDPRLEWVTEVSPEAGDVKVDRGQLLKVVFQLVNNARRAMPEGGRLTLSTARVIRPEVITPRYEFYPFESEFHGVLRVADTGPGPEATSWPQLVEHWRNADPSDEECKGQEISMMQRFAEDSEGLIQYGPAQGRGTLVEIFLPSRCEKNEPEPCAEPQLVKVPEETTILLLLGNDLERKRAARFLLAENYRVLEAVSTEEAVAKAQGHSGKINLIFAEESLREQIEEELLPRLRLRRHPPPILYTHHTVDGRIPRIARLKRPYLRCELVSRVREMLAKRVPKERFLGPVQPIRQYHIPDYQWMGESRGVTESEKKAGEAYEVLAKKQEE